VPILKTQVATGTYFRGNRVATEKFKYNIKIIFTAEKPCSAPRNINAHPKSNDARCSNRASPSAAEMYDGSPFSLEELLRVGRGRKVLHNFRIMGWKVTSIARYGRFSRKLEYWASDRSCLWSASASYMLLSVHSQSCDPVPSHRIGETRISCNLDQRLVEGQPVFKTIRTCTNVLTHRMGSRTCMVQ
jgi:hypothetical protein